jgi:hypothetical protein
MQLQEELSELCKKTAVGEIGEIHALTDRQDVLAAKSTVSTGISPKCSAGQDLAKAFHFSAAPDGNCPEPISRGFEELYDVISRQREVLHACRLLNEDAVRQGKELQTSVKRKLSQIRQQKMIIAHYCPSEKSCSGILLDIRVKQLCKS